MATVQLGSELWRKYRRKYMESLWDFCYDLLHYPDIDSNMFRQECEAYDEARRMGHKAHLILWPRGHLKTCIFNIGTNLQDICINPNIRILILSATDKIAEGSLKVISEHIMQNDDLHYFFPEIRPVEGSKYKWTKSEITVNRDQILQDPTVSAFGILSNLTGAHFEKIVYDDIITAENTDTPEKIEKAVKQFEQSICLMIQNVAKKVVIGTIYDAKDLYHRLKKSKQYRVSERTVTEKDPDGFDKFIFPAKFNDTVLGRLKDELRPEIFASQYYLTPIVSSDRLFKEENMRFYSCLPPNGIFYITVDPASSTKSTADKSAILTCYWAPADSEHMLGSIYIHRYIHARLPTENLVELIINEYVEVRPFAMSIETAAAEGGYLWTYFLSQCQRKNLSGMNIKQFNPSTQKSKFARISMLQPWFQRGDVFMKEEHVEMKDQLINYTGYKKKEHDDLIDALAQQLEIGQMPSGGGDDSEDDEYEPMFRSTGY
jgi:predicted phage terminase large subunit-like protein